jgi:arabinogalactan oligomer / maltooligosaccharide transport system permease protein
MAITTGEARASRVFKLGRRQRNKLWADIASYIVILFFAIIALFPFFWMFRTALAPVSESFELRPKLLPSSLTFDNIVRVVTSPNVPFIKYFENSVIVSVSTTILVIVVGSWGAYALARLKFRGQRTFGASLLLIQMFPGVLLIIPLYVILAKLGLINNFVGLAVAYTTLNLPFVVWLLRGYFLSIPSEIEDAARIDGCTYFGVLWRVVLPLAAPGLAAVATLAFVNSWNEFLIAYVLINDDSQKVLSIGLASYVDQFTTDYSGLFAMATLTTIPVVLVFMVFQRYLVGGLTTGSVKG